MMEQITGRVTLHSGDCRDVLRTLPDNSIDSVVTDPPYALVSIVKRFGSPNAAPAKGNDAYMRASAGFMGKTWDTGETAFSVDFWAQVLRVLKPGGHVAAFGASRGYHRMACAIEDAGFEIRDSLMWIYGTGFPKSHNLNGEWEGFGTALKPAFEPIVLARKPLTGTVAANLAEWGVGALNIDGCRVPHSGERLSGGGTQTDHEGWGRSLCGRTDSAHAEQLGRWPANVCHDGSDDVVAAFPNTAASKAAKDNKPMQRQDNNVYGKGLGSISPNNTYSDNGGSAARFFYSAKASKADRNGSKHPTVKPISLMQWLCRLITPPGGAILDPFAGSGTTGAAARLEGFRAILIEREAEYQQDIRHRFAASSDLLEAAE